MERSLLMLQQAIELFGNQIYEEQTSFYVFLILSLFLNVLREWVDLLMLSQLLDRIYRTLYLAHLDQTPYKHLYVYFFS